MVFIDGGNFFKGVTEGLSVDFYSINLKKFIDKLVKKRNLLRVYYYTVRPIDKTARCFTQQSQFLDKIGKRPYFKLRFGRLAGPIGNKKEKGCDIRLAVDLMCLAQANAYDVAALVSGDGDFVEVIDRIQALGKIVENYAFKGRKSYHLLQTCDTFDYIDKTYLT